MFIWKDTKKRAPAYPDSFHYVDAEGTQYFGIPRELLEEIPDPQPPADFSDNLYYRTEQDDAPYVVYTRKPQEQIDAANQAKTNTASLAYLAETDWMVTRSIEDPTKPVPDDVKAKRAAARAAVVKQEQPK